MSKFLILGSNSVSAGYFIKLLLKIVIFEYCFA